MKGNFPKYQNSILNFPPYFLAVPDVPANEVTNSNDLQESTNYLDK